MRTFAAALILALASPALAQDFAPTGVPPGSPAAAPTLPAPPERAPGYGKTEGFLPNMVIGPKLSIISVPNPSIGLEAKILGKYGFSFDYDLLPDVDVGDVEVGYTDWNLAAKWYPWERSFFVGAAFGSRSFHATATETELGVTATAKAKVSTTYLAPEIGWRWVWNSGFFMGMDLGYQIVLSSKTTLEIPGVLSLEDESKDVQDAADDLGKIGFPIVSLLQVGYFF